MAHLPDHIVFLLEEKQMTPYDNQVVPGTSQPGSNRLTYWIAAVEVLLTFALADAAVIAWSAGLITGGPLMASALAYILIAFGTLFTAYKMGHPRPADLIRI
jgi:hypothetical protein